MNFARFASVAFALLCGVGAFGPPGVGPKAAFADPAPGDQPPVGFSKQTYVDDEGGHHFYSVFVPRVPPPKDGYPIVLFLHGAAERGTDGVLQTTVGLGPIVKDDRDFPAVVVFPQVEDQDGRILTAWKPEKPDGARALKILADVEDRLPVDENHRVLAGWSMGGYGVAAQFASGDPKRWSAAVAVAGSRTPDVDVKKLADASRVTPLWVVAGALDRFVPFRETAKMVAEIRAEGGRVRFTKVRNEGHNVWQTVFASDRFAKILRSPRLVEPRVANGGAGEPNVAVVQLDDEDEFDRDPAKPIDPARFRPDLILERGAFIRADNAALSKLAGRIAGSVPQESLRGTVPDRTETRQFAGHTVTVQFCGLSYSGRLENASLSGRAGNRLTLRAELADAQVTIRQIRLSAPLGHRGVAGPITVRAGVRQPLVLEIDMRPEVVNDELKLTALATRFDLPANDFFVAGPGFIDEDGLFLTEAKLAKRLVEGIYEARPLMAQSVREAAPGLLERIDDFSMGNPGGLAGQIIPLPMIEPVVRVKLSTVQADERGLTALFQLEVGSTIDDGSPRTDPPRQDGGITLPLAERTAGPEQLAVGVSSSLVRALSAELVADGVPRIDARDVPGNPLKKLHAPESLRKIVPGLANPKYAKDDLRARLTLVGPVATIAEDSDRSALVRMRSDDVELTIDRRPPGGVWMGAGVVRLSVDQMARADVEKDGSHRNLMVRPTGDSIVRPRREGTYAIVGDRIDAQRAATLVKIGWDNWVRGEGPFSGPLKDFAVPGTALRVEEFDSRGPSSGVTDGLLVARFAVADTTLENRSDVPVTYRVRDNKNGLWGGPFVLPPGGVHTYRVPNALHFEQLDANRRTGAPRTLDAGGCYRFRVVEGDRLPTLDGGTIEATERTNGSATTGAVRSLRTGRLVGGMISPRSRTPRGGRPFVPPAAPSVRSVPGLAPRGRNRVTPFAGTAPAIPLQSRARN